MGVWYKQGVVIPPNTTDLNGGTSFSGTSNATVIYESGAQILSGNVFKMWFSGANSMYYAESTDGLTWTRNSTAIIPGRGIAKVFKNNGTYYLYASPSPVFQGQPISVYTSTDGVTFTLANAAALSPSGGANWDGVTIDYLAPFYQDGNGTFYGSYVGTPSVGNAGTGIATSTDLIHWTNGASDLLPGFGPLDVHLINNTFYAWGGIQTTPPNATPTDLGRTQTPLSNVLGWSAPITTLIRTQTNEGVNNVNGSLASPSLVEVNGKTFMYYTGTPSEPSGTGYQIMCATANAPLATIVQGSEGMAISFVQSPIPANSASVTSVAQAYGSANTAGNMLVAVFFTGVGSVPTISDTQGNTWILGFSQPTNDGGLALLRVWFALNCKGGANTVTAQRNATAGNSGMIIAEYSGVNTFDKSASAGGNSTAPNSSAVTTTVTNELILGAFETNAAGLTGLVVGTGGAGTQTRQNLQATMGLADNIVSSIGSYSASATAGSGGWAAGILTFFQSSVYSYPDDRSFGNFPNNPVIVQGTSIYTVPKPDSRATPNIPVDSRVSPNIPVDSRASGNAPQNSRNTPS